MFTIYKSNSLNTLLLKAYHIIEEKPFSNIFEKEIFIYDNKVLFQYLNIFIAEKKGISANFKFYHPNDFIWKLFKIILSKKELKNIFTHSMIIWEIIKILDNKKFFENCSKKKDMIKKFKFSFLMASIFKKYILYRPEWINQWEIEKNISIFDKNEQWQIKLWMEIIHNTKKINQSSDHFANLFYNIQKIIKEKKIKKKYLPKRFFIISSFSMNPSYIKIFQNISIYTDIYFLYITPFKKNIFNFTQDNKIYTDIKIEKKNILNDSLITLWGQYEKIYYFYILKSKKNKVINCFKKNKNKSLLSQIKNNFFNDSEFTRKKRFLEISDHSISINICFNKKNEIEVLYEKLLIFLNENSSIKPGDIVVTSFSLDTYISSINLIFKSTDNKKTIPFFIAKKSSKTTEIMLWSFKKILNLSNSRFENEEILELLDVPEIAEKFNFSEEEIKILYHWIEETNIRWGINEKHKNYLLFPKNKQNTWFYGIEKLLLSYAMNDTEKIWNGVLSCSFINGSRSELIGKLISFIKILEKWQKKLSKLQYLKYWRSLYSDLVSDFFQNNTKIEKSIQIIQKKWIEIIDDSLSSNYLKKISINILKKIFFYKYYDNNHEIFLPGVVNFCYPDSVCYIPFKVICMIGTDHTSIPKTNYLDNFNLLKKYPLIGDINLYQKYSYLFVQSLSCAEKYFYISYIGYSVKDESKVHPSILVDQLLNYITLNFCFIGDQNLSYKENSKKITKYLCKKHKKQFLYETKNIESFIQDNIKNDFKHTEKNISHKNLLKKNTDNEINLKDLINFWKHPIRYFYNSHLKIKIRQKKQKINTTETFLVNPLNSFKIKNKLLDYIINNKNITKLYQHYLLSGKLPYHFFGEIFWIKNIKEMKLIANKVMQYRIEKEEKKINLNIEKYQIYGVLSEIQSTGLLRWKTSSIRYSDRIALWLEHLIYSILGGCGKSKIIGYKSQIWSFSSLNSHRAHSYLLEYIKGYIKGMKEPLFLTKSGASWLDQVYDERNNCIKNDYCTKIKAYKKLLYTWKGDNYTEGEQEDYYLKKTITISNKKNIKKICESAEKWLIPILKNKDRKKK